MCLVWVPFLFTISALLDCQRHFGNRFTRFSPTLKHSGEELVVFLPLLAMEKEEGEDE